MLQKLLNFREKQESNITLLINYLFILYAFTLPMAFDTEKIIFKIIFILFLLSGNLKAKLIYALKNKIFQAMLLFLSVYIVWLYGSEHRDVAIWKIKEFASYFFLFPMFITSIREDFKEKILNGFIFAIFTSEVLSYFMMFDIKFSFITYTGFGQNVPFFYMYSQYVLIISISLGLILYKILTNSLKNNFQKFLYIGFFLFSTINIFSLSSKLGYILYSISILTVLIYLSKTYITKQKIIILFAVIVSTYLVAFNFNTTFHEKVHNIYSEMTKAFEKNIFVGSTGTRLAWGLYGMKVYLENNPLVGVGTSDHIDLVAKKLHEKKLTKEEKIWLFIFVNKYVPGRSTLHNEYLDHLVQFGPFGLFIVFYLFYQIYKAKSVDPYFKLLKYILLANILIYCFVNYFFILTQLGKIFFLLIALTLPSFKTKEV